MNLVTANLLGSLISAPVQRLQNDLAGNVTEAIPFLSNTFTADGVPADANLYTEGDKYLNPRLRIHTYSELLFNWRVICL